MSVNVLREDMTLQPLASGVGIVDDALSIESKNAVQNRVVTDALNRLSETTKQMIINENLLINPDFAINQRGAETIESDGSSAEQNRRYFVDRWMAHSNTYRTKFKFSRKSAQGGIKGTLLENSEQNVALSYFFENDYINKFRGKTVTVSFYVSELVRQGEGTGNANRNNLFLWGKVNGVEQQVDGSLDINETGYYSRSFTFPDTELDKIALRIYFADYRYGSVAGDSMTLDWIKMELGDVATPFCPPEPATELLKCQRYYYKAVGGVYNWNNATPIADYGYLTINVPFPVEMRLAEPNGKVYTTYPTYQENKLNNYITGDVIEEIEVHVYSITQQNVGTVILYGATYPLQGFCSFNIMVDAEIY